MTHQVASGQNQRQRMNSNRGTWWQRMKNELVNNKYLYFMALPVILYYAIFCYGPMYGVIIAFKNYDVAKGILGSPWVGFKNFYDFFSSMHFVRLFRNTVLISFYDLIFGFPAPIIFALLLNEVKNMLFKKTIQTITYIPYFISMVVICGMITDFFSTNGVMTNLLTILFGAESKNYLGYPEYFRTIFVSTNIWQGIGWGSIIYIAALSGIDQEQYDAATIDGAGRFKKVLYVTLPGIAPTIAILFILRVGQLVNVGYEKIILLYNSGTLETADVISSFVYRRGLGEGFQFSYTTAVGLFQSVINLIMLFSANFFSKKIGSSSLL